MTTSNPTRRDLALLSLRLVLGLVFVFHGSQKLFGLFGGYGLSATAGWMESVGLPLPMVSATLAGATELLGGLALATGLGLRLLAAPLTFTMLVAVFVTSSGGLDAANGGMEYPLTLAAAVLSLGLLGPGRFTLGVGKLRASAPVPAESAIS